MYNVFSPEIYIMMHVLHQKGIPLIIPRDLIGDHETDTMKTKTKKQKQWKYTLPFPSLLTATVKKATPTFCIIQMQMSL